MHDWACPPRSRRWWYWRSITPRPRWLIQMRTRSNSSRFQPLLETLLLFFDRPYDNGKQSQAREVVPVWYCRRGTVHSTGMHLLESNCKQDRILLSCVQMNAGMAQGDRLLSNLIKHLDANRSQLFLVRFRKMKLQAVVNRILFRI